MIVKDDSKAHMQLLTSWKQNNLLIATICSSHPFVWLPATDRADSLNPRWESLPRSTEPDRASQRSGGRSSKDGEVEAVSRPQWRGFGDLLPLEDSTGVTLRCCFCICICICIVVCICICIVVCIFRPRSSESLFLLIFTLYSGGKKPGQLFKYHLMSKSWILYN